MVNLVDVFSLWKEGGGLKLLSQTLCLFMLCFFIFKATFMTLIKKDKVTQIK